MIEKVCTFGPDSCLTGIVSEPETDNRENKTPAVILLNAGILHRVGPYRLNVDLARKLSGKGFTTFRFDLSGLGDSMPRRDTKRHSERTMADIQEAVDYLSRKYGCDKFVLIGVCSGADNAHKFAVKDERIVGAVFVDGYEFPTLKAKVRFQVNRFLSLCLRPAKLVRAVHNVFFSRYGRLFEKSNESDARTEIYYWDLPLKRQAEADLQQLVERKVNLLFIYTLGVYRTFNYQDQFQEMFRSVDFKGLAQVKYYDKADHLFTSLEQRESLLNTIGEWSEKTQIAN